MRPALTQAELDLGVEWLRFRCLLLDPPWLERGSGKIKRGAQRHYPLLPAKQVEVVVRESGLFLPADNAHMWMWVTDNFLEDGLWLIKRLGFRYIRMAPWVKAESEKELARKGAQTGIGQYLRGGHETLLLAVRGRGLAPDVRTERRDVNSVIYGRRTKHSKKPESSYEKIEAVSKGPRVEFFARSARPGWCCWGGDATSSGVLTA